MLSVSGLSILDWKFLPLNLIQRMIRTKGSLSLYSSPGYSCIILHFMTIRFLFLFQEVNNVLVGGELSGFYVDRKSKMDARAGLSS
jgi:hypothetical protein